MFQHGAQFVRRANLKQILDAGFDQFMVDMRQSLARFHALRSQHSLIKFRHCEQIHRVRAFGHRRHITNNGAKALEMPENFWRNAPAWRSAPVERAGNLNARHGAANLKRGSVP